MPLALQRNSRDFSSRIAFNAKHGEPGQKLVITKKLTFIDFINSKTLKSIAFYAKIVHTLNSCSELIKTLFIIVN